MALYLCFRFCIFDRPILEDYVSQVEEGPTFISIMFTCSAKWFSSCN